MRKGEKLVKYLNELFECEKEERRIRHEVHGMGPSYEARLIQWLELGVDDETFDKIIGDGSK